MGNYRHLPCRRWCYSGPRRALGDLSPFSIHVEETYFESKQYTSGHHIRWQNFFYGFDCDIIYVEGHKNKVADALSCYYESSSDEDLHYDDFISADVHIDKLGEDLPLSRIEEAEEMLLLHRFSL